MIFRLDFEDGLIIYNPSMEFGGMDGIGVIPPPSI